mgnify:CR=1 FL=1
MKKLIKKISLLLIICALVTPGYNVWATGEVNTENNEGTNQTTNESTSNESTSNESTSTETTTPEVEQVKNDDATLKELTIDGVEFTEAFTPEKLEYKAVVAGDISSVKISATPNNVLSKIDASSKTGLQELPNIGDNIFVVKVVAENGKELPYEINVVRVQTDLNLTLLNIKDQKLNEVFEPEKYEYTADVTYNVRSIEVRQGRPIGTKVVVSGNSNLKVGKNTVTVTVKNELDETKVYKIIVTRSSEEKIDEDENEETVTTEEVITSGITSDITPVVSEDNSDDIDLDTENDNTLRSVIIITSTVLLLLIAGLGIYFYVKTGNSEKKRQKKIDKLKRKQAKIEEQLTGLMPVITDEQEKEYLNKTESKDVEIKPRKNIEEELESTIEIDLSKEIIEPRKRRVEKHVLEDNFDDFDDLFDDRDE